MGLFVAPAANAQDSSTERRGSLLVEILDPSGRRSVDVSVDRLALTVDGVATPILALDPVVEPWRIALYFDQRVSGPRVLRNAALELTDRARTLTDLGSVEVVFADSEVRTAAQPTRDPLAVLDALSWTGLRRGDDDRLLALRRTFLADLDDLETGLLDPEERARRALGLARGALSEETEWLRRHREQLVRWVADHPADGPAILLLISDGFDGAFDFYSGALAARSWTNGEAGESTTAGSSGLERPIILPSIGETARILAAHGWIAVPWTPSGSDPLTAGANDAEWLRDSVGAPDRGTNEESVASPALISSRALERQRKEREAAEALQSAPVLERSPLAVLDELAAGTGGVVLADGPQLEAFLKRLPERRRLVFATDRGELSASKKSELVFEGRRSLTVHAPAWVGRTVPESVAAVRARQMLAGGDGGAGRVDELDRSLSVAAAVEIPTEGIGGATLAVQIDSELQVDSSRLTVGVRGDDGQALVFHRPLAQAEAATNEAGVYRIDLPVAVDEETEIVALVEELTTNPGGGRWGSAFASVVKPAAEEIATAALGNLLPAPKPVNLLAPQEPFVYGRTPFEIVVSDARVSSVELLLDGRQVSRRPAPPFGATIDLGSVPRTRRIEAVAYGADGTELGRDLLLVNEGSGRLRVEITAPDRDRLRSPEAITGPITVVADVQGPPDQRIDRVEFFWNTERVGTRFGPPYRQQVVVPENGSQGFVRVVAYLDDGAVAEDAVFLNSPGSADRVEVQLVELFVVVNDRRSRPIEGLTESDFRVLEEGTEQQIASFSDAGDLPLTVGLAMDASASMFVKLPRVQRSAAHFVERTLATGDRAFLVSFGEEARLEGGTTSQPERLVQALGELRPDGQTALWEAIVFSLVQIQGASGKKALVVYTDGADEDESFSYKTCYEFARRLGVPIYVILTNNEIVRTGGRSFGVRGFTRKVRKLVEAVGGRLFLARVGEDLDAVYAEIEEELRSQYLLTYYPSGSEGESWRRVKVEVEGRGREARTIAGYFP